MKKIFVLAGLFFVALTVHAQQPEPPAAQLAHKIADKMKDTLGLDNQQRAKIFSINMELHLQKTVARGQSQNRTVVGASLQQIEGRRDGMYKGVLTAEQYLLYLQKKRNLVSNN